MTPPLALQYGWRCGECGWQTFDVDVMRSEVNRLNGDRTISLVCPACRTEGRFVDAERPMACHRPIDVKACPTVDLCTDGQACAWPRPRPKLEDLVERGPGAELGLLDNVRPLSRPERSE